MYFFRENRPSILKLHKDVLIRLRDKGLCKIMHPQDAIKEMTPPLKSFAFILSLSPFTEATQKGTISATLKGHFL